MVTGKAKIPKKSLYFIDRPWPPLDQPNPYPKKFVILSQKT